MCVCYERACVRVRRLSTSYQRPETPSQPLPPLHRIPQTTRQSEFRYWQRKKPTSHLEAKVKNVKFIGELVKFKVRGVTHTGREE